VTHGTLDQIKLAQHKLIAKKLQENPETILALARRNLRRYIDRRPAPATSLWREWRTLCVPFPLRLTVFSSVESECF
jgi:hypothetical protein